MRPFVEGGGYWLCIPKPWNGRKFLNINDSGNRRIKRRRLETIISRITSAAKRRDWHRPRYCEGQSLFILPKTLSKCVRQWKLYENRFKQWLDDNHVRKGTYSQSTSKSSVYDHHITCSGDVSSVNHSSLFEEEPLRAFYTIWHSNMNKVSKRRLSTTEEVLDYIDSVWRSKAVERSILKSPKGGISGPIEDPSSLSAKARITLQRWSRVISHYNVGDQSGEDDDPLDMWNHSIENSMVNHNAIDHSPVSSTQIWKSSSRKRIHEAPVSDKSSKTVECPVQTSKSTQLSQNLRMSSTNSNASITRNDENSPLAELSPENFSIVKVPYISTRTGSVQSNACQDSKTPSGTVRRSQRILMNSAQNNATPKIMRNPTNMKKNPSTNSSNNHNNSSAKSEYKHPLTCGTSSTLTSNNVQTPHIKRSNSRKHPVAQCRSGSNT